MSDREANALGVTFTPAPDATALAGAWRELEGRADGSFFTSWTWIGQWLEMVRPRFAPRLLQVVCDGRVVGLGLLIARRVRRLAVLPVRQLLLHTTGDTELDELTIEYNGLLAERGLEAEVARAAFGHLLHRVGRWDECVLDGCSDVAPLLAVADARSRVVIPRRSPCHTIDLDGVKPGSFVEQLEARTRRSVRRSLKEFGALGPVLVEPARSAAEASAFLEQLKALHQAYWQARGQPGSFASPAFDRFHARLVAEAFASGAAEVLRLRAGEAALGYTYNFLHRGRVLQYQSGFDYGRLPGRTPGLVAHALAAEHYAGRGFRVYDFLAGDADYKQRMGRPSSEITWAVLQRTRLRFRAEDWLRSVQGAVRARRESAVPQPQAPTEASEGASS